MALSLLDLLARALAAVVLGYLLVVKTNLPSPVAMQLQPIWRRLGFWPALRTTLRRQWVSAAVQRDFQRAIALRRATVELGLRTPDLELIYDLTFLGISLSWAGDPGAAAGYLVAAEKLTRWQGLKWRAALLERLGRVLTDLGRVHEGEAILDEAIHMARKTSNRGDLLRLLHTKELLLLIARRPAEARDTATEALTEARLVNHLPWIRALLNDLAAASIDLKDFDAATTYLTEAESFLDETQPLTRSYVLANRAYLELALGNVESAQALASACMELRERSGGTTAIPKLILALTYFRQGMPQEGMRALEQTQRLVSHMTEKRRAVEALDELLDERRSGLLPDPDRQRLEEARLEAEQFSIPSPPDTLLASVQKALADRTAVRPRTPLLLFLYSRSYGLWTIALAFVILAFPVSPLLVVGKALVLAALGCIYAWGMVDLARSGRPHSPVRPAPSASTR